MLVADFWGSLFLVMALDVNGSFTFIDSGDSRDRKGLHFEGTDEIIFLGRAGHNFFRSVHDIDGLLMEASR